jgi:hypothetical protein
MAFLGLGFTSSVVVFLTKCLDSYIDEAGAKSMVAADSVLRDEGVSFLQAIPVAGVGEGTGVVS